tara:strand:+ start:59 stop:517 length:459 start_codon:yes stop_codon:yes gene_type:complete
MIYKLISTKGEITATSLGDDAAHSLDIGSISPHSFLRISEVEGAGDGAFVKVTSGGTTVTSTNGSYLPAASTITLVPEGERPSVLQDTPIGLEDGLGGIRLEGGAGSGNSVGRFGFLTYDRGLTNYTVSAINSTSGGSHDCHILVEEVAFIG